MTVNSIFNLHSALANIGCELSIVVSCDDSMSIFHPDNIACELYIVVSWYCNCDHIEDSASYSGDHRK